MKANQTRSRRQTEASKNKRLFFFHFRGQFCFDLAKVNQVLRLQVIKYCLIQFSRTFRKRDKRDNWLDNEGGGENAFFGRKYFFHSRSDFAKSRSTIVQSLPKPSWLSSNAITTKNEFSLYRKSREKKDEKKKWIGKINKITKKPSRGSFVKQTVGTRFI